MSAIISFFENERRSGLLILFVSTLIYGFYFQRMIVNANSSLFTLDGDCIKNYYTFIYHIQNGDKLLEFGGMNHPFGEHLIYTDCQPLLSFLLKPLKFTHPYLAAILHVLLLLSYIITPLILMKIFENSGMKGIVSFFSALAIAVLSPQIQRLGGHFSLAYNFVIPQLILFTQKFLKGGFKYGVAVLFCYNFLLFFIHPYFGFGASVFCFISILCARPLRGENWRSSGFTGAVATGMLPLLLFKLFMLVTDSHVNRPTDPYGLELMTANIASVFTPYVGAFRHFMQQIIKVKGMEWEGLSYVGVFTFFLAVAFLVIFLVNFRRSSIGRPMASMFAASVVLLLFSFGLHNNVTDALDIRIDFLRQFRALGRFAWYFYFMLPVFLITQLYRNVEAWMPERGYKTLLIFLPLLYFGFNMLEGHSFLHMMSAGSFRDRNIFNANLLNDKERQAMVQIRAQKPDAIFPLPMFHTGSEVYGRAGNNSVLPAFLFSAHLRLPVMSVMLSRTSITETEQLISVLDPEREDESMVTRIADERLLVIITGDKFKPDEYRLKQKIRTFHYYDSLAFGVTTIAELDSKPPVTETISSADDRNTIYIETMDRKPFTETRISERTKVLLIRDGDLKPGAYTVSYDYYLPRKDHRQRFNPTAIGLKVSRLNSVEVIDSVEFPALNSSRFFKDHVRTEDFIDIKNGYDYLFEFTGFSNEKYQIKNFRLEPAF